MMIGIICTIQFIYPIVMQYKSISYAYSKFNLNNNIINAFRLIQSNEEPLCVQKNHCVFKYDLIDVKCGWYWPWLGKYRIKKTKAKCRDIISYTLVWWTHISRTAYLQPFGKVVSILSRFHSNRLYFVYNRKFYRCQRALRPNSFFKRYRISFSQSFMLLIW